MKRVLLVLTIAACSKKAADSELATTNQELAVPADLAWKYVDGASELGEFAASARTAHLKPYAYLHASWCGPCNAIEKTHATDPQMADAFKGTAIALLDIEAVDQSALVVDGLDTRVIPVFFKLDAAGKPTGDKIDGGAWSDNVPGNMAPPLKAFFAK